MKRPVFILLFLINIIFAQSAYPFAFLGTRLNYESFEGGNFPMSTLHFILETKANLIDGLELSLALGPAYYYLSEANGYSNGYYYKRKIDPSVYLESAVKYKILNEGDFPFTIELGLLGSTTANNWKLKTDETGETLEYNEQLSSILLRAKLSKAIGEGRAFIDLGRGTQTSALNTAMFHSEITSIKIGVDVETVSDMLIYSYFSFDSGLISWYTGLIDGSHSASWTIGILRKFDI